MQFFVCLFVLAAFGSLLLRVGFLQLRQTGATLRCGARASHCGGFSCCGAQALGARASVVVAHGLSSCGSRALERRLSSCGARAQLLRGLWDLPGPGLEPVSPALAGGFLTTAPPGKSSCTVLENIYWHSLFGKQVGNICPRFFLGGVAGPRHHAACGILAPQPRMEPGPSAVKVQNLNHWTAREFPSVPDLNTYTFSSSIPFQASILLTYIYKDLSTDMFITVLAKDWK